MTWEVAFHMEAREVESEAAKEPHGPFEYLHEAVERVVPQTFFITGKFKAPDRTYPLSNPIAAIVYERAVHTPAERRVFLDNIVSMLELMEAQRDVDRN